MRRVALALAVAGAVAVLVPAASAALTLKFTTSLTDDEATANGFVLHEDVLRNGKRIGTDRAVCSFYPVGADRPKGATCRIAVNLRAGTIRLAGRLPFDAASGHLIVVGGTGKFAGASGAGSYRALDRKRTAVTLHLV